MSSSSTGFTTNNYHYVKCWVILNSDGQKIFRQIFTWGFQRPQNEIKAALFAVPNYSNSKYRSDFNASQRKLIDDGADLNNFDLGLFYLLLQRICSLPPPSDISWRSEGDPDSLPNILYQIKLKRNDLAHSHVEITESEKDASINLYKFLFDKALDLAAIMYGIDSNKLDVVKGEIQKHISDVETSSEVEVREIVKEIIVKEEADIGLNETELHIAKEVKEIYHKTGENLVNNPIAQVGKVVIDGLKNFESVPEIAKNLQPAVAKAADDVKEIFKKFF